ncbi:hypothetical protein [uncultured Mediterranean phage uvMED]|nr:hypothetical protein [uncultured Mediterranean phage uvMED]BAQ90192.1 hypothetical protein [uncultured Mediterranean phage uvMED]BAR19668.1 hypothetical protein [uncultured Mediterranean phage uvMED]
MASYIKDGQVVKMTEEEENDFNERFNRGRNIGASAAQPVSRSGGGGKGGRPDINPNTNEGSEALAMAQAKFNNDGNYGYYNNEGRYISFMEDAFNGGGMNTTDTFFAGGPLSNALNVAKVRPMGMARERDAEGNFMVDRADIGYRDATDMTDGGGPQFSGGPKMGGGTVSAMANLIDFLGGVDQGKRKRYKRVGLMK